MTRQRPFQTYRPGRLGVRPVINANATLTTLGGSLLAPPALKAMIDGAAHFVDLHELRGAVCAKLAELTRNEAAAVTSGAAAAVTLTVAACTTGESRVFPVQAQVVMFRSQRNDYDYGARLTGAGIVEVGPSVDELRMALQRRPVCVLYFAGAHYAAGALPVEEVVPIAREAGVPVIVDAAAQIPPVASLWRFTTELGADLVIFSGGKGLRGPQSTGLILGSRELVERCRSHGSPYHEIGRGMKVGKEELLALLAAVEWTLGQDEETLLAGYERTVTYWLDGLADRTDVQLARGYPSEAGQPHSRALIRPAGPWAPEQLIEALWAGDPRVSVGVVPGGVALNPQTLEPGEAPLVLTAVRQALDRLSSVHGQ